MTHWRRKQQIVLANCLVLSFVTFQIDVQQVRAQVTVDDGPQPIVIERTGGKALIPDVARDEVIGFAIYTVQNATMKMSVQMYPLRDGEERQIHLQTYDGSTWTTIADSTVDEMGWHSAFRIENWDHSKDVRYRVQHSGGSTYEGLIRKDPGDKKEIVVAGFTGNSNSDRSPRTDIIKNIKEIDPDLLFFLWRSELRPPFAYSGLVAIWTSVWRDHERSPHNLHSR